MDLVDQTSKGLRMASRPFSSRTMVAADWKTLRHFRPGEFVAPEKMGYEFMLWLDELRETCGIPFRVTSSYRSPAHNAKVGGANDSSHCDVPTNVVDLGKMPTPADPNWNLGRWIIVVAAIASGCKRIGIYQDGSLHIDRTEHERPAPRLWHVVNG